MLSLVEPVEPPWGDPVALEKPPLPPPPTLALVPPELPGVPPTPDLVPPLPPVPDPFEPPATLPPPPVAEASPVPV